MNKVLILSGAGLSAESGIRTFRDSNGLWEEFDVMEVCSAEGFIKDRSKVLDFYDMRRRDIADKQPNAAHLMIAELKNAFPENIAVLTQNVDDLLERAECTDVIHLHGTLRDLRCESCGHIWDIGYGPVKGHICPQCRSGNVRHNVVMFHEPAPEYQTLYEKITECHKGLFVAIGTSGQVIDAGGIAKYFRFSVLNNRDPEPSMDYCFSKVIHRKATEAAPEIRKIILNFINSGELA
ncbi:MAG TPA: Sir2 family NAD-dependent protein deacetylase [bacterium]|nr:Sir2 family NAD-dependent protein deacetylase [bacterium]